MPPTSADNKYATVKGSLWEKTAFIAVVCIILLNFFLAYTTITRLSILQLSVTHSNAVVLYSLRLRESVIAAQNSQRLYFLTSDPSHTHAYFESLDSIYKGTDNLRVTNARSDKQKISYKDTIFSAIRKIDRLRSNSQKYLSVNSSKADVNKLMLTYEDALAQLVATSKNIESEEYLVLTQLTSKIKKAVNDSVILLLLSLVTSILLLGGAFLLLQKRKKNDERHKQFLKAHTAELEAKVEQRTQALTLFSEELSRSNRELEDFAFVASHDLQEPLRKVRAFSSRIKHNYEKILDDKGIDYLNRMDKAASRMSKLIEDLLEFSRIKTRGKEFIKVDLNSVVKSVIDDLEIAIENSGAQIKTTVLPSVDADISQMNQLFLNLFSNAIKFRKAGVNPVIAIEHETIERAIDDVCVDHHCISITDNGIGFDSQYAEKIFQPFQRLHARDDYDGTGIGLSVCRRIIERHGGELIVSSRQGEGSIFKIFIPVSTIDLLNIEAPMEAPMDATNQPSGQYES